MLLQMSDGVTSVIDAGSLHFIRRTQRIVAWRSSVGLETAIRESLDKICLRWFDFLKNVRLNNDRSRAISMMMAFITVN
jgi:hypothetical protein